MASHRQDDFGKRRSQTFAVNTQRRRELDWKDTRKPAWVAWLSILCVIALFIAVLSLASSDRVSKPQNINGDQLGPYDVSREQYDQESAQKISEMQGEQPRWALVSPEKSVNATEIDGFFAGVDGLRVSTLLVGPIQWKLPEPAAGMTRLDVFNQAVNTMSKGSGLRPEDIRFDGIVVFGPPQALREIDQRPGVLAVEPAHPEAVYGRIGIRPVTPPEEAAGEAAPAPAEAPAPEPAPEPAPAPAEAPAP